MRSSELSPSSSSVAPGCERAAARVARNHRFDTRAARRRRHGRRARLQPGANLVAFQFLRALGARQLRAGPDLGGANALVICELRVRRLDDVRRIRPWLDDERNLHALFAVLRDADGRGVLYARHGIHDALDVFGKDVEPFRRDDHFLLAAADEEAALPGRARRYRPCGTTRLRKPRPSLPARRSSRLSRSRRERESRRRPQS